jgi:photosystem II stability/assembly factor-like uncharacterized protein
MTRVRLSVRLLLSALIAPALAGAPLQAAAEGPATVDGEHLEALELRSIGPYRGGRVTAVTGVPGDRHTFYMGSTGGGVWKSTDAGLGWANVSDEEFEAGSIGAVAVAPSDSNVVYAGTGSACPRGNVSPGIGVYRSTDAGDSWTHVGLGETGQIGRIRVHPEDPDLVYVAALGHIFGPNAERGVFRSGDGGASWEKVLFVSDRAGAVDLAMDPTNPRILFAAIWEAERKPWTFEGGGEQSGLWRSKNGGDSWQELTEGLPAGILGRIGVTVSAADPDRVWALVEAEDGGLFRSDNGGDRFRLINPDRNFRQRAWYYTHVYADPGDRETVYVLNTGLYRSHDGGKEFEYIRVPHGDQHDLWIHPEDPRVLINGNDGGANVSLNGGESWTGQANQPTAEMYRVTVDDRFPYHVYGCQQDNSCVAIPSRTDDAGIDRHHWYVIGGCESGHVAVDPRDPNVTYSGCYGGQIDRYDHATGRARGIMAYPQLAVGQQASDLRYRFQWNAPIRLSPHDPEVLYHASQFVHRSTDRGQSWQTISPDLSRNDGDKQGYAGGPITRDNTGVEVYGTVFAFEESPLEPGLLWAGTDDGRVHLSRDGGESWAEITPPKMPEWGTVNTIELSAHAAGRAIVAVTRYRMDDFRPYVFRTDDFGASWSLLTDGSNGIPESHFVRVVREDPVERGLLYAGTEFGLYVSFDDGAAWQPLQLNLPATPITDLAVRHGDLVVATQGRSFWILDDLGALRELRAGAPAGPAHLFQPRAAYRFGGGGRGAVGKNPPYGAILRYWLPEEGSSEAGEGDLELVLEILDGDGVLRTFSSHTAEYSAPDPWARFRPAPSGPKTLPVAAGLNQWVWDLRLPDAKIEPDAVLWGRAQGPRVPPGDYTVRLTLGDWTAERVLEVRGDPRLETTLDDWDAQYELARKVWQSLGESHRALARLRDARTQVNDLAARLEEAGRGEGVGDAAEAVRAKLTAIEERLYQTRSESGQDVLNFPPKLDNQILTLLGTISGPEARPSDGATARYQHLRGELDGVLAELETVFASELAAFNELAASKELPPVIVPSG